MAASEHGVNTAPEPVRLVQLFHNSVDIEAGEDEWATVEGVQNWLRFHTEIHINDTTVDGTAA